MFISVHTEHASNFKDYKIKHPILNSYLSKQSKVKKRLYLGDVFSYHHTRKMTRHMYLRCLEIKESSLNGCLFVLYMLLFVIKYLIRFMRNIYEIWIEYLNIISTHLFYRCV